MSGAPPSRLKTFYLPFSALCLTLIACTFPEFHPVYSPGLDPPLAWVFNYTFLQGNDLARDFLFPHGPLSFLLYPLPMGHNILLGQAIYTAFKCILFFQLCLLTDAGRKGSWIPAFAAAYLFFLLFEIQFVMLAIVVAAFCLFLRTGSLQHAWIPILVSDLGF